MDKKVVFFSFNKEAGIIKGISEDIEIENTATGLVSGPMWAFKLSESEATRFSKEKDLVYDNESKYWTFGGNNPLICFHECMPVLTQEAMLGSETYLAKSYDFLS